MESGHYEDVVSAPRRPRIAQKEVGDDTRWYEADYRNLLGRKAEQAFSPDVVIQNAEECEHQRRQHPQSLFA